MNYIENKTFDEIAVGDNASLVRTISFEDIESFASVSGDINPAHVDIEFARDDMFHGIIAHGMWGASLISALLGTKLPGPGTIYLSQDLNFLHPIKPGDTVTVTITAVAKNAEKKHIDFDCKCVIDNGKIATSGMAKVIAPTIKIKREAMAVPRFILETLHDKLYTRLAQLGQGLAPLKTAVVHPCDELSIKGALEAAEDGIIVPILVGPEQKIRDAAKLANLDISPYQIIVTRHSHESADVAVKMARELEVEALMKGHIHTDELMLAAIDKQTGIRTDKRMSHVFALDVSNYHKPLFLTDAALNLFPSLEEKVDIVQNAIDLFQNLGFGIPKVAIISALETVNAKIPSTLDAAALCKMAERGQICGGILDGPLAFDNAISVESAQIKGIQSPVAGNADIIVVPDVESGNMLYKQMTYLSQMEAAGIVIGAKVPIILTSRGSDEMSRKMSSLMALIYARNKARG